jgi:hypothetical protein
VLPGRLVDHRIVASTLSPGAVIVLRDGQTEDYESIFRAEQIRPDGSVQPIKLPARTGGIPAIASGAGGTYIGLAETLLHVDADLVARAVPDVPPLLFGVERGLGAAGDGSVWIAADTEKPVVRLAPGLAPLRIATGMREYGGIALATSNDAWLAEFPSSGWRREALVRVTAAGKVFEHVVGSPPTATATVLSPGGADAQAGALVVGKRDLLRIRVRCSAACSVRLTVTARAQRGESEYGGRTVRFAAAGSRVVTLRRRYRPFPVSQARLYALYLAHDRRTPYLVDGPAARPGAGTVLARR